MRPNEIIPMDINVRVIDPEGLVRCIEQYLRKMKLNMPECYSVRVLPQNATICAAIEYYLDVAKAAIDADNFLHIEAKEWYYYEDDWKRIAPYLCGYIEWANDAEHERFRDVFDGKAMKTIYPHISWSIT